MILKNLVFACGALMTLALGQAAIAQSTDANFPTNVTTNEIVGTIRARDVGDSRLTSYYYTFDGGQGDMFINVVSRNFAGDIDVFAAEGLRPLTKMVIFAEGGPNETGRLIYMRKPERLILRVQGRTPDDDAATFQIKFGGSFIAMAESSDDKTPKLDRSETVSDAGIKVNSVGTIVAVIPKPQPPKKTVETVPQKPAEPVAKSKPTPEAESKQTIPPPPEVTVSENIPPAKEPAKSEVPAKRSKPPVKKAAVEGPTTIFNGKPKPKTKGAGTTTAAKTKAAAKTATPPPPVTADPMASIHLVVLLKDGNKIEHPMNEVVKFSVDKGVLTVITKEGLVTYPMLDVAKVTISP
jgi:hypothetical protein